MTVDTAGSPIEAVVGADVLLTAIPNESMTTPDTAQNRPQIHCHSILPKKNYRFFIETVVCADVLLTAIPNEPMTTPDMAQNRPQIHCHSILPKNYRFTIEAIVLCRAISHSDSQ